MAVGIDNSTNVGGQNGEGAFTPEILIVDPSLPDRKQLRARFEAEGISVMEAPNGIEALELLARWKIGGVISEILMPRMDGYRLCREMRANERLFATPFVFHSGVTASPQDEKFSLAIGADAFLKKNAEPAALLQAIRGARPAPAPLAPTVSQQELDLMREYNERLVAMLEQKNNSLEEALNQVRLQGIALETAANAVVITDVKGHIVWINPAFTTLTGFSREEVIGKTPRLLKSGRHDRAFYTRFWQTILSGETWRSEFINRRKDGALYHDEHTVTPVRNAEGKITHFIGIMHDVTANRQAEASLRLFRTLMDRSNDGFHIVDPATGRFLDVNDATCEQHGYTRGELLSMSPFDLQPSLHEKPVWSDRVEDLRRSGSQTFQVAHQRKDGSQFPVEVNVKYVSLDRDYLIATVRDITERKRVDAALRESEARFRELAETIEEVFWMVDPADHRMIYVSPAYEKIWGRTCQSLYDSPRTWLDSIHPDDRPRVLHAVETKQPAGTYDEEYRILRPDGSMRWIHDLAFPVRNATGQIERMVGVGTDITKRRELEDRFRQSQKMEAIGLLAGGVAHDFNNILGATMMQVDLALMDCGLPERTAEALQQIRSYAERAANLTRQLLLFSRRQVMQPANLDLNEVVNHLSKMLQRIIGEDVRLQMTLNPTPLLTYADAGMLDQVLMNLAVNARDAMPDGGRLIIETAARSVDESTAQIYPNGRAGSYVWLSVSDTGTGIPRDVLPRIFEPFFTTKELGKGTGLGLATVFGIVQQHNGWIKVYSEPGHGANFQVFLPVSETLADARVAATTPSEPPGGTETILLVEDDPRLRILTKAHLERRGYTVMVAANGPEAFAIWEKDSDRIQLLLTDVILPEGFSGHQIAQQFHEAKPGLNIILTSGYSPEIAGQKLVLRKNQAFLQKPCPSHQLLETVRRCLDGAGPAK